MILNNASYAKHNGDEIAFMKLNGVIVFRNQRFRCVEYTVNNDKVNPLNYKDSNGLPLLYKSADDYSTDYYEQIEIILKDGTTTTDVTTRCDLISKVKVWWPSSVIGISFAHGTTKLVKRLDYVYILPSFEDYYPFFEHGEKNYGLGDSVVTSLNVSNWNVPNCHNMFRLLTSLKTLTGLENWDTSNSVSMSHMFQNCSSLTSLNLSNWDTSKVKSMSFMFSGCSSLTSLGDISTWDTRKVKNMGTMFDNCSKLTSLDLSGWHTDSLEETAYMFDGCEALETLDIRNFDYSNIGSNHHDIFRNCYALKELRLDNCSNYTIKEIIKYLDEFDHLADGTKGKIYVKRENVTGLEAPQGWEFVSAEGDEPIQTLYVKGQFREKNTLTEVTTMVNDTHTDLSFMFYKCSSLTTVNNISDWDTSNVTSMGGMFDECKSLKTLDVSNFNTCNVTDMNCMFCNCGSLTELGNLSNWDVSSTPYMSSMFENCCSLTTLDLSNWVTSNLQDTGSMFRDCINLQELNLSNFDMSMVTYSDSMFENCRNLTTLRLDSCSYETVEKIITSSGFPTNNNNGTIFCSQEVYENLTPPGNWYLEIAY